MVTDAIFRHRSFSLMYIFGSLLVLCGFVLVNWRYSRQLKHDGGGAANEESGHVGSKRTVLLGGPNDGESLSAPDDASDGVADSDAAEDERRAARLYGSGDPAAGAPAGRSAPSAQLFDTRLDGDPAAL